MIAIPSLRCGEDVLYLGRMREGGWVLGPDIIHLPSLGIALFSQVLYHI